MASEANRAAVEEEVEVLSSIYGNDFARLTPNTCTVTLPHSQQTVALTVTLSPAYPLTAPPTVVLTASSLKLSDVEKAEVQSAVQRVWCEAAGEVCCYQTVEAVRELIDVRRVQATTAADQPLNAEAEEDEESGGEEGEHTVSHYSDDNDDDGQQQSTDRTPQQWLHFKQQQQHSANPSTRLLTTAPFTSGLPYTDRKSVFIAHTTSIHSPADLAHLRTYLLTHPKLSRATHNISAYRLTGSRGGTEGTEGQYTEEGCDDDGEDRAGGRLLHLLRAMNCENCWVCVSRWYGGVKLGSDRFRIINNVARQLLEESGYGDRKAAVVGGGGGGGGGGGKKGHKR